MADLTNAIRSDATYKSDPSNQSRNSRPTRRERQELSSFISGIQSFPTPIPLYPCTVFPHPPLQGPEITKWIVLPFSPSDQDLKQEQNISTAISPCQFPLQTLLGGMPLKADHCSRKAIFSSHPLYLPPLELDLQNLLGGMPLTRFCN